MNSDARTETLQKRLLLAGAWIYLAWWFLVEFLFPNAFNPLPGRLIVVGSFLVWSYFARRANHAAKRLELGFFACSCGLTAHYFYLFYHNARDVNWVVGSYITVIAVGLGFQSPRLLLIYSLVVLALAAGLMELRPHLVHPVFLPGLATLLLQANVGLRFRLKNLKQFEESAARFNVLFNATFEGIAVHELGRILDANEPFAFIFGYSRAEMLECAVKDLIHPSEWEKVRSKFEAESELEYETLGLRRDGSPVPIVCRGKRIRYGNKIARIVTVKDLTAEKEADRNRMRSIAAQEAVRVRDEFISIAAHELRTPLTSVKLKTGMGLRRIESGDAAAFSPEKVRENWRQIDRQTDRLVTLVDNMLDVSRLSLGRLEMRQDRVDFSGVVVDALASLSDQMRRSEVKVVRAIEPELTVEGDGPRLEQVVVNLLTNALKYGEKSPVHVELRKHGGEAWLVVRDEGPGIALANAERIFNRFERAADANTASGLGLGLYIARQVIEAHGGTVTLQSEPGNGASFLVRLPLRAGRERF